MSSEKPVPISDHGEDYEVHVDVANDCTTHVVCLDSSGVIATILKMTPFEASMVANAINRAAERADAR